MEAKSKSVGQPEIAGAGQAAGNPSVSPVPPSDKPPQSLSTAALIKEITSEVSLLAKKQIDLAKTELQVDLKREIFMITGLGVAAMAALIAVNLLLVTAIFALALVLPGWVAGLIVSGFMLLVAAVAGIIGWSKRVRSPLERTRRELKEDVQWTKEHLT